MLFSRNNAQSAGVNVNELKPLNTVEAAMVNANCLYNCPEIPLIIIVGINTASNTSTTPTIGPVISPIAFVTASRGEYCPVSSNLEAFSTTTIASSTTMATARISPNNVSVLIEKPNAAITANVPINDTGMVIQGIITALQFCKNRKITRITSKVVSKNVTITSSIEAWITSVVSKVTLYETPLGKLAANSSILAFTPLETSSELEPGCW